MTSEYNITMKKVKKKKDRIYPENLEEKKS